MMQSLEFNLNFWSLLLVSMVHVLLLLLPLHHISLEHPMEKEFIAGPKKFHVFLLRELLLVLPLLRLKIVLKQTYVFLIEGILYMIQIVLSFICH